MHKCINFRISALNHYHVRGRDGSNDFEGEMISKRFQIRIFPFTSTFWLLHTTGYLHALSCRLLLFINNFLLARQTYIAPYFIKTLYKSLNHLFSSSIHIFFVYTCLSWDARRIILIQSWDFHYAYLSLSCIQHL